MLRSLSWLFAALALIALPLTAQADPADIDAAARGVVRVVIMGNNGENIVPVSHGSGFAVTSTQIVTNAHVVRDAALNDSLSIGIVPSEGEDGSYARIVSISPNQDLALLEITGDLRLPALTISGNGDRSSGEVTAVGYPMNVDRAQGLDIGDLFRSQPPVKSRGSISGSRPSRMFDTILHTAPIARGNSGGPLLDPCGRVLGVNSFGTDADSSDAEFFFAVSMKELIPFLKKTGVNAKINELPCRSLAELDAAERARVESEQEKARTQMAARSEERRAKQEQARTKAEMEVQDARENAMMGAFLLVILGAGLGLGAWQAQQKGPERRKLAIALGVGAIAALAGAAAMWLTRPGLDSIERKVNAAMQEGEADDAGQGEAPATGKGALTCTLDVSRSRITGVPEKTVSFGWAEDGCVNQRTQYGYSGGDWSRVFVPNQEEAVSVNRYDPASRTFRTDRYLLGLGAMAKAREARGAYTPPKCGAEGAAAKLGDLQGAVLAQLPAQPNERLVYKCEGKK